MICGMPYKILSFLPSGSPECGGWFGRRCWCRSRFGPIRSWNHARSRRSTDHHGDRGEDASDKQDDSNDRLPNRINMGNPIQHRAPSLYPTRVPQGFRNLARRPRKLGVATDFDMDEITPPAAPVPVRSACGSGRERNRSNQLRRNLARPLERANPAKPQSGDRHSRMYACRRIHRNSKT